MEARDDDPLKEALRRLIGYAERLPLPCRRDVLGHLFSVQEWFSLLRRIGIETVCLALHGRRFDLSLLLEVGALTTNRLVALFLALSGEELSRQSFFTLMHLQVESQRGMDAAWAVRTFGVQALADATNNLGLLEEAVLLSPGEESVAKVRQEAVECAVSIGFFVEAMRRRVP